jgi:DNA-binding transcriptional LysR family regulator
LILAGYDSGVELRHLRYFVAVAEERHFGRAAERLRVAQPPLSRQIRDLEGRLGVRLFERHSRGAEPTEAARLLLPEARAALAHAERLEGMARRAGRGELGSLAVGFVGSATYATAVTGILREFRGRFPEVELTLREMSTAEQARALNDGLIGAGFVRPPVGGEGEYLDVRVVVEEPLVAALPGSHRLSHHATRSIRSGSRPQRVAASTIISGTVGSRCSATPAWGLPIGNMKSANAKGSARIRRGWIGESAASGKYVIALRLRVNAKAYQR